MKTDQKVEVEKERFSYLERKQVLYKFLNFVTMETRTPVSFKVTKEISSSSRTKFYGKKGPQGLFFHFSQLRDVIHRNLAYLKGHMNLRSTPLAELSDVDCSSAVVIFHQHLRAGCQHQNPYFSTGVEFPI